MSGTLAVAARSALYNLLFYLSTIVVLVTITPVYFFLPQRGAIAVVRGWARFNLWLLKAICGTEVDFRGLQNLPDGAFILAAKHQSLWETFALLPLLGNPAYVIKRQLLYVPIWGWWAWKAEMIYVDRGKGTAALRQIAEGARRAAAAGRPILIFPEGTRRPPGAPPDYRAGIVHLYAHARLEVVPAALNSGLYWPRRRFLRYPGTIIVEFLPPIAPGLRPRAFLEALQTATETACDRLLAEAAAADPAPPLPPEATDRLDALQRANRQETNAFPPAEA